MLKVRVIPTLLLREVNLVKGPGFDSWRAVGTPMQAVKVYNRRDVDELVLLDIAATPGGSSPDFDMIGTLAREAAVPMTIGGGIRTVDDFRIALKVGADKVSVNSAALADPDLIRRAAELCGSQAVVVSIDYRVEPDGRRMVYSHCGTTPTGRQISDWAREVEAAGAGEILLTEIARDGTLAGYDIEGIAEVAAAVSIPVVASGGARDPDDMVAAVSAGADAVAAGALYLFTQVTPGEVKARMAAAGIPVRLPLVN
jgi:cyclase